MVSVSNRSVCCMKCYAVSASKPALVTGIGRKRGSASTRLSHARKCGIRLERDAAFGRMRNVRIGGDVRDGRRLSDRERLVAKLGIDDREEIFRHLLGCRVVLRRAEHRDQTRGTRAIRNLSRRQRQPALHRRGADGIFRQPRRIAVFAREIDKDRIRIGHDNIAVFDHRHFAERIECQMRGLAVVAGLMLSSIVVKGRSSSVRNSFDRCP